MTAKYSILLTLLLVFVACSNETPVSAQATGGQYGTTEPVPAGKPNIVFILTDDMRADDLRFMPKTKALVADEGLRFDNAFVTDSVCCPSRATALRGQYAHNHGVHTNKPPDGSGIKFRELGRDESTVATWLDGAGYRTGLYGIYLKRYDGTYVPPGWDSFAGLVDGGGQYADTMSYGGAGIEGPPEGEYPTDWLAGEAESFIRNPSDDPFFLYFSPTIPHVPAVPPERHEDLYPREKVPRSPAYNERDVSDKPPWIRNRDYLNAEERQAADELYRDRARSLAAVDDAVERFVGTLRETGELDNTYIVFTSDNGFHMGEHRLPPMKQSPYEVDIKVPLLIRGPGVPVGERQGMALNNDFAPTFARWGGAKVPSFVDGRSLEPLIAGSPERWRRAFLIEKWGPLYVKYDYKGVRTANHKYVSYEGEHHELYKLRDDPHELRNVYRGAGPKVKTKLENRLAALKGCSGQECRRAEN